jgi:hypothetical protein
VGNAHRIEVAAQDLERRDAYAAAEQRSMAQLRFDLESFTQWSCNFHG